MDVNMMAATAMITKKAMVGQEMSVAMVKQQLQNQQAAAQMVEQAAEQTKAAAASASAHIVDVVV